MYAIRSYYESNRPGSHSADVCRIFQDLLHAGVGIEGFAFLYADRGEEPQGGGIAALTRLFLDDFVQQAPERVVTGGDEVCRSSYNFV